MKIIKTSLFLFLLFTSSISFANQIVLTGRAAVLEPHGNYYSFPKDYQRPLEGFHLVFVGGTYRVCHLNQQPELQGLDLLRIFIELNGLKYNWYCYVFSPKFFKFNF